MRVVWLTDLHLNFVDTWEQIAFVEEVRAEKPGALLIGGDLGESHTVCNYLSYFEKELRVPIYFVLGNHDYYGSSISSVAWMIKDHASNSYLLRWLEDYKLKGIHKLNKTTGIIGRGGWGDARAGNTAAYNGLFYLTLGLLEN